MVPLLISISIHSLVLSMLLMLSILSMLSMLAILAILVISAMRPLLSPAAGANLRRGSSRAR
jgi:hypothetical protein